MYSKKNPVSFLKPLANFAFILIFLFLAISNSSAQVSARDDNPGDMGNVVLPGAFTQRILRITVKSTGTVTNPEMITRMVFNLGGTINPSAISSANVYLINQWGGIEFSSIFNTATVSGGKLSFEGLYRMEASQDYTFDLFYNVADNVIDGDKLDAAIESVTIDGAVLIPLTANGTKLRSIMNQGLTGTITVDNTLAVNSPRISYNDFVAMLADLNKYGVGNGGLTVLVKDDQTFSYTSDIIISQTGLPGSPLLIKRSGDGTNPPLITKQKGGGYFNYFIIIHGARFLTIDGINFKGTDGDADSKFFTGFTFTAIPGQTVESVEIKNCTIDLDMLKDITSTEGRFGGVGIRIAYSHQNPFEGSMNSVKIHHNTFLNLREGISLERRNGKLENIEIYNNTITNFINNGISVFGGDNRDVDGPASIHDNKLTGLSVDYAGDWGGNYDYRGIYIRNAAGKISIYNNQVNGLSNTNEKSRVFGIMVQSNVAGSVSDIFNNMISGLSAENSTSSEACSAFSLENTGKYNLYNNSALLSYSTSSANSSRILLTYNWEQVQVELINNIFVNKVLVGGTAKTAILDIDPARLTSATDHNLYFLGSPGENNYINLNGGIKTLEAYRTQVPGKELNSFTDSVPFVSSGNLHIRTDVQTKLESAGKPIALPIAILKDIDGDTRNSLAPDLGADEGSFIEFFVNKSPGINSISKPAPVFLTDGQQTIPLSGISDGDAQKIQNISISATSSDPQLVRIDELNYIPGTTTGILKYTPIAAGKAIITIKLKDDGGTANNGNDSVLISFQVISENSLINNIPVVNPIPDLMVYTTETSVKINLSGIGDGDRNKDQLIEISVSTDEPAVLTELQAIYMTGNTTGIISFKPGTAGIANVYLKLKDNGDTLNFGIDTLITSFMVEVKTPGGNGFVENFNDNTLTAWYTNPGTYELSEQNEMLKIIPVKTSVWDGYGFSFPKISIKDHPYVSLKIKSNFDFNISMAVGALNGVIDNYPLRIETIGFIGAQEVVASGEFQEYSFDFTGLPDNILADISNLHFVLNPLTRDFGSAPAKEIYFDDIKLGEIALHTPAISNIPDQVFTVDQGSSATREVSFRNVTDGSTDNNTISIQAFSSSQACIPDPQVIYTSPGRTGKLLLQPDLSLSGESEISVFVTAPNTVSKVMKFIVKVIPNAAPSMKVLPDVTARKGETFSIQMDNIDDGNPESLQYISITGAGKDTSILGEIKVNYDSTGFKGRLSFTPAMGIAAGTIDTISVKLKDNAGLASGGIDSAVYSFTVAVYDEINEKPTFDSIPPKSVKAFTGPYQFQLTGISDGDNNTQNLSFEIISSSDSVFTDFTIGAVQKGVANLNCNLTGKTGSTTVTIKLNDDGGKSGNNGNGFIQHSFVFTALQAPLSGLVADYKPFSGNIAGSGIITYQKNGIVEILSDGTVHISGTVMQQSFPANWFDLGILTGGKDLDISANKYVSFRFKGAATNKIEAPENKILDKTKIFFRLIDNISPGQPGSGYDISVIELNLPNDDEWHDVYLDFTGLFYKSAEGKQTDSTRITKLMLDINCLWFQQIKGDYYFKDLKLGDLAERPVSLPQPNINAIPDQVVYLGQTPKPIMLTGISDGSGNHTAQITVTSDKPDLVSGFVTCEIVNGISQLTFSVNSGISDSAIITVIADNPKIAASYPDTVIFRVYVVETAAVVNNTVAIDLNKTYQVFAGMGTMMSNSTDPVQVQQVKDLNITMMRLSSSGEFEPVNDNTDPNVTSYTNFNRGALPSEAIRMINENTDCHTFFYTPWSPPNWMKQNKGSNPDPAAMWATNNRLKPEMYEEFAEYLLAICKTIKEDAGVELYAISLQNEPTFNEPYPSCQYTGEEFREMMKIIGPRFEAENINTRIMMPEDIATMISWVTDKINPVVADPEAAKYLDIMAVHLYDPDGINVGGAGSSRWKELLDIKNTTSAEGLWMTETSGFGNVWEGYWGKDYMSGNPQYFPGPLDFAGSIYTAFKDGNISGWTDFEGANFKTLNDLSGSVFKNYSAFLSPGSVMVDAVSSNSDLLSLAFKNSDNTLTAILINKGSKPLKTIIKGQDVPGVFRTFITQNWSPFMEGKTITNGTMVLPPHSITTLHNSGANLAPTIEPTGNLIIELSAGEKNLSLSGIGYGPDTSDQTITSVTAVSENPVVATTSVNYVNGASSAILKISPASYGTSLITVKVKDNGGSDNGGTDTIVSRFYVRVVSAINKRPSIDIPAPVNILEDSDSILVMLPGITDGDNGTQFLQFSLSGSNPLLLPGAYISYETGNDTADLVFKPAADLSGSSVISIVLSDDGGDESNNGNQSVKLNLPVTVIPVNDAPVITASLLTATFDVGKTKKFQLAIEDGDPDLEQLLSYDVTISDPEIGDVNIIDNQNNTLVMEIKGTLAGTATVVFFLKDNGTVLNGGVDSARVVFTITVQNPLGIDQTDIPGIKLYPNPADNYICLSLDGIRNSKIEITDVYGKPVLTKYIPGEISETTIKVHNLPSGLYFVTVIAENKTQTIRFVKLK